MSVYLKLLISSLLLLVFPLGVTAEENSCAQECGSGERLVSFGDGNNANCACIKEGEMDETVSQERNVSEDDSANQSELEAQAG